MNINPINPINPNSQFAIIQVCPEIAFQQDRDELGSHAAAVYAVMPSCALYVYIYIYICSNTDMYICVLYAEKCLQTNVL